MSAAPGTRQTGKVSSVLEKVADSLCNVVQSWDALHVRTTGRLRMYGLHHRAAPTKPIAFTSVALRDTAPRALSEILAPGSGSFYTSSDLSSSAENVLEDSAGARVAVFYSLCTTQPVCASCLRTLHVCWGTQWFGCVALLGHVLFGHPSASYHTHCRSIFTMGILLQCNKGIYHSLWKILGDHSQEGNLVLQRGA